MFFGQKKCDQIARELGVTFKPFDKSDRKNGFQRITFTGPNVLAINGALDMLDEAVTKFNRHKLWERRTAVAKGLHATPRATQRKQTTVAKNSTKGSRFSALTLDDDDDDDESKPATTTPQEKKAPKKWTPGPFRNLLGPAKPKLGFWEGVLAILHAQSTRHLQSRRQLHLQQSLITKWWQNGRFIRLHSRFLNSLSLHSLHRRHGTSEI